MHDHRSPERLRLAERVLHRLTVVPVDGTDVLQAEILEHALRGEHVLQALHAVQHLVRRPPTYGVRPRFFLIRSRLVPRLVRRLVRQAADGRAVGAAVVVDDDDELEVLGGGDVVQRLPGHPAGQAAVADQRDHMPVLLRSR